MLAENRIVSKKRFLTGWFWLGWWIFVGFLGFGVGMESCGVGVALI